MFLLRSQRFSIFPDPSSPAVLNSVHMSNEHVTQTALVFAGKNALPPPLPEDKWTQHATKYLHTCWPQRKELSPMPSAGERKRPATLTVGAGCCTRPAYEAARRGRGTGSGGAPPGTAATPAAAPCAWRPGRRSGRRRTPPPRPQDPFPGLAHMHRCSG